MVSCVKIGYSEVWVFTVTGKEEWVIGRKDEKMQEYTGLALVYDTFMDNVPYEKWFQFIKAYLNKNGIKEGILLDLGCGTGEMTERFAKSGYDMIGVDLSIEMLNMAMKKSREENLDILYLFQDMREFELYGTVAAVISVCDCMNYLLQEEDLLQTFRLVNNYLDPGGLFIFDFNTLHKYRDVIGDTVIAENRENCSFIWENSFDENTNLNQYDVTIFTKKQIETYEKPGFFGKGKQIILDEFYEKCSETHVQRGYTLETMRRLVEESGMIFVEAIDADTQKKVTENSERIYIVAKEQGK